MVIAEKKPETETASHVSTAPPRPERAVAPTVLQVLPSLGVSGGVERTAIDLTAALTRRGWRALVASAGGPLEHEIRRAGGEHFTLPLDSKNPLRMSANARHLAELIRAQRVDVVHARSRAPAWSAHAAARRTGVLFVTTFHGTYGHGGALKRRYNRIMLKGERVIANSAFIGAHIRNVYGMAEDRLVVIPRGVDVARFDPEAVSNERMITLSTAWRVPDGRPVVLLPGRITRWKGQEVLLDALVALGRPDVFALLVGDDQRRPRYRAELLRKIGALGLEGQVRLIGPCRDMPAAYKLADVVVSASTDPEAFGRVAVEAQAMGRPVIATDHGGSRETVIPGATGWLVPPGDAAALAGALERALRLGPAARAELAAEARHHVLERFTVTHMTEATMAVYSDLLAWRRG